jgi:glycosyltransferase involved in cell wall biosynthesis
MKYKRITLITSYYPPEKGAAANRIAMMAEGFKESGFEVHVICPLPNYPDGKILSGYRGKILVKESLNGIVVWRLPLYPSNSRSGLVRLFSMFTFALPVSLTIPFITWSSNQVIVQCPPLPVTLFAVLTCKVLNKKVIVNVSDLWPLSAKEMGALKEGMIYTVMNFMASIIYTSADMIIGQSNEILSYIDKNYTRRPNFLYRNIQATVENKADGTFNGKLIYAGLLGHAQKISDIVQNCQFPGGFEIYGNGGDLENLKIAINTRVEKKIIYHGMVTPAELSKIYPNFSYSLIPLSVRIHGAVPSKLFDAVSRGVPVIFMGGGEGAELVLKHGLGYVIEPGNFNSLNEILENLNEESYKKHYANCLEFSEKELSFKLQFDSLRNFIDTNNE